ncbi:ferredoxin [Leucobacter weissii]|uniref:Ferredoxin n=1 Tax=Leucobacter weissii TaxID=1983706 RepID=A0A939MU31_9MICO|nr:ferredoxin [Leucobacter weissii]MBO1902989.1 ferredoxin [Leucobacter weissii]
MSENEWQVSVSGRCIGAGLCLAIAPDHFRLDGIRAQSTGTVTGQEAHDLVVSAAGVCPARAITMTPAHAAAE